MFNIAKITFNLDKNFLSHYIGKQPNWGYSGLGYIVYKRTYSRQLEDGNTEEFYQTLERVINGIFSYQKNHCLSNYLPWSDEKAQRTAQKMFRAMWDFKFLPPGRGLWTVGTDHVYRNGGSACNNCFTYETEVLTSEGIIQIGDLGVHNKTAKVMTTGGKWVEAPFKSYGVQNIYELTLRRSGIDKVIRTTADHRWFAEDRRQTHRDKGPVEFKTIELRPGIHKLQYCFGQGIKSLDSISEYGIEHGIVYGDGTKHIDSTSSATIKLCGNKNIELSKYFKSNNRVQGKLDTGIKTLDIYGLPRYYKSLPPLSESKSYLIGFMAGYFAADGTVSSDGSCSISSCNKDNIYKIRELCQIIGIGTYGIQSDERISNLTNKPSTLYKIVLMRDTLDEKFFLIKEHKDRFLSNPIVTKNNWQVISVIDTGKTEEVFCCEVKDYGKFVLADNILTGNCAFVSTKNMTDATPFAFLMDMLMLGVGVGFDTFGANTCTIYEPSGTVNIITIPDTREGWVLSVEQLINSYMSYKSSTISFDYSLIRKAGLPIKGFGGVSSGPAPLIDLHKSIINILDSTITKTISSTHIVDICNLIGKCVVSGNVRRSAELSIGNSNDIDFINLKQDKAALESHRWVSNNSVSCEIGMDYTQLANLTATNGEPGYVWLENARKFGRMSDLPDSRDHRVAGFNPCVEMSLESYELCTLVESFPANHDSLAEYLDTLKLAYLYAKTITLIPTHVPSTNAVMMRNRRIGCSQSGIINAFNKHGRNTMLSWCNEAYDFLKRLDQKYSEWLCIPKSIKMTTVKPSGTVSLLSGQSPGIHYPHSEYYIRRVRFSSNDAILELLKKANYHIEKDVYSDNTVVVSFPVKETYFSKSKDNAPLFEQVANAVSYQECWADNSVSITATFSKEEASHIPILLSLYESKLKSISFLPLSDHGYKQPPYETINEETYNLMSQNIKPIQSFNSTQNNKSSLMYCDGDKCTII